MAAMPLDGSMSSPWGGRRRNRTILVELEPSVRAGLVPVGEEGWNGDLVETECFGFSAARSVAGPISSLPTTTRVPEPITAGILHRA